MIYVWMLMKTTWMVFCNFAGKAVAVFGILLLMAVACEDPLYNDVGDIIRTLISGIIILALGIGMDFFLMHLSTLKEKRRLNSIRYRRRHTQSK